MNGCAYRTADDQCQKFSDPVRNTLSWCVGDEPCEARKLSNADRIRQMTDEELAEIIACVGNCGDCFLHHNGCDIRITCKGNVLEWLKREVDDGQAKKGNS